MTPDERYAARRRANEAVTKAIFDAEHAEAMDQRLIAIEMWTRVAQYESQICDLTRGIQALWLEYEVANDGVGSATARAQELMDGYPMHRSREHARRAYAERRRVASRRPRPIATRPPGR